MLPNCVKESFFWKVVDGMEWSVGGGRWSVGVGRRERSVEEEASEKSSKSLDPVAQVCVWGLS